MGAKFVKLYFVSILVISWNLAGLYYVRHELRRYLNAAAYCVVAVEALGRQIPIAFLERIKEDFTKRYGGGKAATAVANSLNKEFG